MIAAAMAAGMLDLLLEKGALVESGASAPVSCDLASRPTLFAPRLAAVDRTMKFFTANIRSTNIRRASFC